MPEPLLLLALVVYAIYRQTRTAEVTRAGRFKIALGYAAIAIAGVIRYGWSPPSGIGWAFLLTGICLSATVGIWRGKLTRMWMPDNGRVLRRGTTLTVTLFVAMVAIKICMSIYARSHGIRDGAEFAEIILVVAIMVAVQAEIVFRRAEAFLNTAKANR